MNYVLVLIVLGYPPQQIGPFDNVFACERAGTQLLAIAPHQKHARYACINLKAKPHHWNGKDIPK